MVSFKKKKKSQRGIFFFPKKNESNLAQNSPVKPPLNSIKALKWFITIKGFLLFVFKNPFEWIKIKTVAKIFNPPPQVMPLSNNFLSPAFP